MKFLIDAQLPRSLSSLLCNLKFDSIHTLDLPNQNATLDSDIIKLSKEQGRIVVSKDSDFLDSHLIKNLPEKLIIIRTGNISNKSLLSIFEKNIESICEMLRSSSLIEVTQFEIISHK